MTYNHDDDAFITKVGTAKVILDIVNNEKANEISKLTLEDFKHLILGTINDAKTSDFGSLIERVIKLTI